MPAQRTPRKRKAAPLVRSSVILRGLATAITLSSLGGMTAFAATHVQNTAAPLQPSASTALAAVAPTATPAATSRKSTTTTRRSTTITGVTTTTGAARTKTKSS